MDARGARLRCRGIIMDGLVATTNLLLLGWIKRLATNIGKRVANDDDS